MQFRIKLEDGSTTYATQVFALGLGLNEGEVYLHLPYIHRYITVTKEYLNENSNYPLIKELEHLHTMTHSMKVSEKDKLRAKVKFNLINRLFELEQKEFALEKSVDMLLLLAVYHEIIEQGFYKRL